MSNGRRGNYAEQKVASELRDEGWIVKGTGDAHGTFDLIALRDGECRLIQVKASSVKRGKYADFPPHEREKARAEAEQAGFPAWLVWAPPDRKPPRWIPVEEWR